METRKWLRISNKERRMGTESNEGYSRRQSTSTPTIIKWDDIILSIHRQQVFLTIGGPIYMPS